MNEVLDFAASDFMADGLCARSHRLDPDVFEVIGNYELAEELAFTQQVDIATFEIWNDLREGRIARAIGDMSRAPKESGLNDAANQILEEVDALTRPKFASYFDRETRKRIHPPFEDLFEDVSGDLTDAAQSRLMYGPTDPFYELLFEAYKGGGWPCGWRGKYPDGQMIVFHPAGPGGDD